MAFCIISLCLNRDLHRFILFSWEIHRHRIQLDQDWHSKSFNSKDKYFDGFPNITEKDKEKAGESNSKANIKYINLLIQNNIYFIFK